MWRRLFGNGRRALPRGWRRATFPEVTASGVPAVRPHPDGEVALRLVEREDARAFGVWDVRTGELVRFLDGALDAWWTPDGRHLVTVDDALAVTVLGWPGLSTIRQASLEFDRRRGVGGLELAISASGRFGAVSVYSGQSEAGYAVFSIPEGGTLSSLPYVAAEFASAGLFSPDERHFALVVEPDGMWWAGGAEDADWDTPARGGPVAWARLFVQETRDRGSRSEYPIEVDLPRGWTPGDDLAGSTWPRNVRFAGTDLVFDTPWGGECAVPFPPPGPVLAPPPRA